MQSAKKQPGPRKTGPGKGGNYEYLYKKGRHVPAGARLCGTDAVSGPAAENPSDTLRDHDCKKSTLLDEKRTTLYSAYLMEILDETVLRMEVYEADKCIAAESICLKRTEVT